MTISAPIFIVGTSRSGKSLLGSFLAIHKDTCWFSNYSEKCPSFPAVSILNRIIDLPILAPFARHSIINQNHKRFLPRPEEGERIYHSYCKFIKGQYASEDMLTSEQIYKFKKTVKGHVKYHGRNRFINDQSANTHRIRMINSIFPNSYFIHVIRDGRAIANEVFRSKWWQDSKVWWYGDTPSVWEKQGNEPVVMCGIHWEKTLKAVFDSKSFISGRYIEIRYEDLTDNPKDVLNNITKLCGLEWDNGFEKYIPKTIENQNYRWKNELTKHEIRLLEKELEASLTSLNYM